MSIEKVIYALLTGEPDVVAIVGTKIYPSYVPQTVQMPAISYEVVSRMERTTVASAESKVHVRYRVQIDSHTQDYPTLLLLVAAVRKALANRRGTFAGVEAVTIRPEFQGMDTYNADADIYARSTDVLATLLEPVS